MIDDAFVIDGAVHVVDWSFDHLSSRSRLHDPETRLAELELYDRLLGGIFDFTELEHGVPDAMTGSEEANYELLFKQSPTDMAIVGSLAFGPSDEYDDPDYSLKINHRFAAAYPDRCIFGGGIQPWGQDLDYALDKIEWQVRELGAQSMKFYPFHWHADDVEYAYPLYEKCRSLGVKILQFHYCQPGDTTHNVEMQRPIGIQAPARDFPEMTFVMHHPMPLYFEETLSIASRFPNIYLVCSPLFQLSLVKPRLTQELVGQLLQWVGPDRLVYGSEGAMGGNTTRYVQAVMDFEISEDLRKGYGYPEVTREDKEKILALNIARVFGIDVDAKREALAAQPSGA